MSPPVAPGGPGGTPLLESDELARWAGVERLWLKREDHNPTGSHKDRGAAAQVAAMQARDQGVGVISSSGNAALAAATYGRAAGISVVALVAPRTETGKLAAIVAAGGRLIVTTKPINYGIRLSRVTGWPDLRPSQSAEALEGFRSLGAELAEQLPEDSAVFGYCSSGATYEAVGEVLAARRRDVSLHPVQAGLVNGISAAFGREGDRSRSMVGDLGAKHTPRSETVARLVRSSGGQAWWVGDQEIAPARDALLASGLDLAAECWAALAGVRAAVAADPGIRRATLVVTGRGWPHAAAPAGEGVGTLAHPAEDFAEVRRLTEDLA